MRGVRMRVRMLEPSVPRRAECRAVIPVHRERDVMAAAASTAGGTEEM
jgi:hypothetical protein